MFKDCFRGRSVKRKETLLFLLKIKSYLLTGSQQTTVRFHRILVQISEGFPILLIQSETTQLLWKLLRQFLKLLC